jgi:hypothetical protein
LIVELFGEILFGIAGAVLEEAISDEEQARKVPAAIGHLLMGMIAGVVSLLVLQRRVIQQPSILGTSLIVAPLSTGLVLEFLGKWWVRRGNVRMALFTFWGGFWFALGMAAIRFVYLERAWTWF